MSDPMVKRRTMPGSRSGHQPDHVGWGPSFPAVPGSLDPAESVHQVDRLAGGWLALGADARQVKRVGGHPGLRIGDQHQRPVVVNELGRGDPERSPVRQRRLDPTRPPFFFACRLALACWMTDSSSSNGIKRPIAVAGHRNIDRLVEGHPDLERTGRPGHDRVGRTRGVDCPDRRGRHEYPKRWRGK